MARLTFPEGFLWGAGTSSFQVEGGIKNDWSLWCEKNAIELVTRSKRNYSHLQSWGHVKDSALSPQNYVHGACTEFEKRYESDLDIAKELGHNAHRFSVEWANIEPVEGVFNQEAIEHYRMIIRAIKVRGMEPMITLWWWTNPLWVMAKGGWHKKETLEAYIKYVERVVDEFKNEGIHFWQPLNEPGTAIGMGYVKGLHPPGISSLYKANKAFANLMEGYRRAYDLIHQKIPGASVGISHYARYMMPYKNLWWNKVLVQILDYVRNWRFLDSLKERLDFIGIQYYRTSVIRLDFFKKGYIGPIHEIDNFTKMTDMGWSMFPEGIYHLLKQSATYGKDIYISENGIADAKDEHRGWWIKENLRYIHKAITEGVPVKGYFHWSLIDIFEWDKGYWPKFGLVEVDFKTQKRTIRPSAYEYARICKENAVEVK